MKKFLLIDANLLLFRSFYAAQAINQNNLGNLPAHLFFNTFIEIIKNELPDYVFFAFDAFGKTKRHEIFDQYKAGRTKAPDELYEQKKLIRSLLDTMELTNLDQIGDEADDLIATICNKYKNDNIINILSEDRDLLQLVDKNVNIVIKNKDKSINDKYIKITIDNFYNKFQFNPNQVTDYKAIAGDMSDNLKGIKGIGPKSTIELLKKYQHLENIYENINELKEKQKLLFLENKDNAFLCKKLATLNIVNINIEQDALSFNINNLKKENIINQLEKCNLRKISSIIKNL